MAVALVGVPEEDQLPAEEYVLNVLEPGTSSPFGPRVDRALREAEAGVPFLLGPIPANDTLTGTDGTFLEIARWRGPFPITETVSTASFRARVPNAQEGDVVSINPRFQVRVEEIGPDETRYSVLIGGPDPYPELGPEATLTSVVDANGTAFRDRVDVPVGATFRRPNDRVAGIPQGWYTVVSVTDESLTVARLRSPLLEHAFKDVIFALEVVERI